MWGGGVTWFERLLVLIWVCWALIVISLELAAIGQIEADQGRPLPFGKKLVAALVVWAIGAAGGGLVLLGIRWVVLG